MPPDQQGGQERDSVPEEREAVKVRAFAVGERPLCDKGKGCPPETERPAWARQKADGRVHGKRRVVYGGGDGGIDGKPGGGSRAGASGVCVRGLYGIYSGRARKCFGCRRFG